MENNKLSIAGASSGSVFRLLPDVLILLPVFVSLGQQEPPPHRCYTSLHLHADTNAPSHPGRGRHSNLSSYFDVNQAPATNRRLAPHRDNHPISHATRRVNNRYTVAYHNGNLTVTHIHFDADAHTDTNPYNTHVNDNTDANDINDHNIDHNTGDHPDDDADSHRHHLSDANRDNYANYHANTNPVSRRLLL